MRRSLGWAVVPTVLFLIPFFLWPVLRLLALSVWGDDGFTLAHFTHLWRVPIYGASFVITFEIAALVTLLSILLSYPLAYLMAASRPRTRQILTMLVLLPFWMSALVRTTAWLILLQHNGVINALLMGSGLLHRPLAMIYNMPGVLIGMTHVLMPFIVLPLAASFRNVDPVLIQAAEGLGAGSATVVRRFLVPLTAPAVIAGATIVFISALGYYITPALMGGAAQTMVTQLIDNNIEVQLDWNLAAALSVVLLAATIVVFIGFNLAFGVERLMAGGSTSPSSAFHVAEGRSPRRIVAAVLATPVLVFLLAPVVIVFPMSLGHSPLLAFPPTHLTLIWYRAFFQRPAWMAALWNSLIVAAIAVPLATIFGTTAAIGIQGLRRRWARLLELLMIQPIVMPPMILAIGLFLLFAPLGLLRGPWGLALGHTVLAVPFVFNTVRTALLGFNPVLAQSAEGLGAPWPVTFRRIMLPIIMPGIISGAIFAFIISFDDVVLSLFLTNIHTRTLPKLMFEGVTQQIDPVITAASALITLMTIPVLLLSQFFGRRQEAITG